MFKEKEEQEKLVEYGQNYAKSLYYKIDDYVSLALSARIAELKSFYYQPTQEDVENIVDNAICEYGHRLKNLAKQDLRMESKRYRPLQECDFDPPETSGHNVQKLIAKHLKESTRMYRLKELIWRMVGRTQEEVWYNHNC